ncbi:hypothetical protein EV701_12070 [Chthoniobacter flavus]|uniref:hypothetical protein n=1 Tax=Chthoniobacter flavus TaxID=191863 RepID=UPI001043C8D7|nr:hypothetical protein [Chthoniobacter flavus]TCO87771.1 hypothetical protein EV701_12070 [Chthoniobacter flavus]
MKPQYLVWAIIGALLAYPLSMGPACSWYKHSSDRSGSKTAGLARLYGPIILVGFKVHPLQVVMQDYQKFWDDLWLEFDPNAN